MTDRYAEQGGGEHNQEDVPIFLYDGEEDVPQNVAHVKVEPSVHIIKAQSFFVHSYLRHVELPQGLRIIKRRAFFMCEGLTHVGFPSTLEEIGTGAFVGCAKLSEVILPKGLKALGSAAFANCESLTHFKVPPLVRVIDVSLFSHCKNLYAVELAPDGIWRLGSRAFKNCHQLRNIVLPNSLKVIENGAFSGCTCLLEALSMNEDDDVNEANHNLLVCQGLKTRYDSYPLQKLCYYHGYDSEAVWVTADSNSISSSIKEALQQLDHLHKQGKLPRLYQCEKLSGMTPLHVLALSSQPSLELCQAVFQLWRTSLANHEPQEAASNERETTVSHKSSLPGQEKDRWNRDPLMYASMNLTPESTAITKYLFEALLSHLLKSLRLAQWRLEVTDEMDRLLYHSASRSERVQHMEQVFIKLNHYIQMERLSLLELAVWKASMEAAMLYQGKANGSNGQRERNKNERALGRCVEHMSWFHMYCYFLVILEDWD
ncbi:MAG: hypothetical protein SGBAC_010578 [Bacillariaceae sp.]